MPTDYPMLSLESAFAERDYAPVTAPCACPMCSGAAVVDETGVSNPQGFLNASERGGVGSNGKQSYTIDEAGFEIIRGDPGWSGALGVGFTVTYGFRANEPTKMPSDTAGFSRFNEAQIRQAELA